jgi:hypothetical protein
MYSEVRGHRESGKYKGAARSGSAYDVILILFLKRSEIVAGESSKNACCCVTIVRNISQMQYAQNETCINN